MMTAKTEMGKKKKKKKITTLMSRMIVVHETCAQIFEVQNVTMIPIVAVVMTCDVQVLNILWVTEIGSDSDEWFETQFYGSASAVAQIVQVASSHEQETDDQKTNVMTEIVAEVIKIFRDLYLYDYHLRT